MKWTAVEKFSEVANKINFSHLAYEKSEAYRWRAYRWRAYRWRSKRSLNHFSKLNPGNFSNEL